MAGPTKGGVTGESALSRITFKVTVDLGPTQLREHYKRMRGVGHKSPDERAGLVLQSIVGAAAVVDLNWWLEMVDGEVAGGMVRCRCCGGCGGQHARGCTAFRDGVTPERE